MKKYVSPSVVEFGKVSELIQGCGGWGGEFPSLNDADSDWRWVYNNPDGWRCLCASIGSIC
ncbi:hypothetical protein [Lihuaxuella thermophila]|uniref:Uncharacterized protein n=1 Tax=Lihuaxuella thermophila TaxID=1173111 RepID=A0A1H8G5R7_9BACL|nr:hypothetical protein [Lihuaxuella thermophila]SEN39090.1 hypothetical protein SAMN05444955_11079 [Lihuaxuella thermophila]